MRASAANRADTGIASTATLLPRSDTRVQRARPPVGASARSDTMPISFYGCCRPVGGGRPRPQPAPGRHFTGGKHLIRGANSGSSGTRVDLGLGVEIAPISHDAVHPDSVDTFRNAV